MWLDIIAYREFYDVPRMFLVEASGNLLLFDCPFDDDLDEFSAIIVFESKETYDSNSNSPEQSAWYEEFREHIVDEPEWFNGNLEVAVTS